MLKKKVETVSKERLDRRYVKVRTIIASVGFTLAIVNIGIEAFVDSTI